MLSLDTQNAATYKNWNCRHWVISVIDYLIMISICHPLILLSILNVLFAPVGSRGTRGRAVREQEGLSRLKKRSPPPSSSAWLSQLLTADERDSQIFKWKETENEGDEEWGKEQRSQQSICASTASEKQQMAQKAKHCQTCCQMRRMFFMKPEPPPLLLLEDPACHI